MARIYMYLVLFATIYVASELKMVHGKQVNYENVDIKENYLPITTFLRQQTPFYNMGPIGGCPLCDSSVYSYCDYKVLHDSCCCNFPVAHHKPPQCYYYDCSILFAKSCYEHSLIQNCCCNNPY